MAEENEIKVQNDGSYLSQSAVGEKKSTGRIANGRGGNSLTR